MTKQTQAYQYVVSPENARNILKDVYGLDVRKPVDGSKYTGLEMREIEQLLTIINHE